MLKDTWAKITKNSCEGQLSIMQSCYFDKYFRYGLKELYVSMKGIEHLCTVTVITKFSKWALNVCTALVYGRIASHLAMVFFDRVRYVSSNSKAFEVNFLLIFIVRFSYWTVFILLWNKKAKFSIYWITSIYQTILSDMHCVNNKYCKIDDSLSWRMAKQGPLYINH